jgi:uncharacterized protein YecE (DUF72 family)
MDFGKLPNITQVDFTLPPDPPCNHTVLSLHTKPTSARLYVGATGYAMKEWLGTWYAAQTPTGRMLHAYGQLFNSIEHNTTHYRIPDGATTLKWRDAVPPAFCFSPKVPQSISHDPQFGRLHPDIATFCVAMHDLGDRLGCCFLQLPPSFSPSDLPKLDQFLKYWDRQVPLAVEVRHPAFFSNTVALNAFLALLTQHQAYTVITDVAGRRDVCHQGLSGAKVVIRLVGNGLHPTDYTRLDDWMQRLNNWYEAGLEEAYLFCHQPDNLLAPEYCAEAIKRAKECLPAHVIIPNAPVMWRPPSEQLRLF